MLKLRMGTMRINYALLGLKIALKFFKEMVKLRLFNGNVI